MPSGQLPPMSGLLIGAAATMLRRRPLVLAATGLSCQFELAGIDRAQVANYRKLFGNPGEHIPLGYYYLLAQRAQLALMLGEDFPYRIPGLVHTRNELRLHTRLQDGSALRLWVSVMPRQEERGRQAAVFSVEIKQAERLVVSCHSEYRAPRKRHKEAVRPSEPEKLPEAMTQIGWVYETSLIRRYAKVSGDYNPIHLSSLMARAFGFKRAIAHGMYSVGRAVASIEQQTARPVIAISGDFRRPVHLPAQSIFGFGPANAMRGTYGVLLPDEQRLALSGAWEISQTHRLPR